MRVVHFHKDEEEIIHASHPLTVESRVVGVVLDRRVKKLNDLDVTEGSWRGLLAGTGKESGRRRMRFSERVALGRHRLVG